MAIKRKETYYRNIQKKSLRMGRKGYVAVPARFFIAFSIQEAVLLAYLISFGSWLEKRDQTKDEWFKCSSEWLETRLGITRSQQRILMEKMTHRGIIKRKMMGDPAKRWIRLDSHKIRYEVENPRRVTRNGERS